MEIELVIFDLFGVLFRVNWGDMKTFLLENDLNDINEKSFNEAFRDIFQLHRYKDLKAGVELLAERLNQKDNLKFKMAELEFLRNFKERVEIDYHALSFMHFLKHSGFKVAVLSNSFQLDISIEKELGLDKIDGVFLSCDTKVLKPDREAFLNVCRHFGLTPQNCLLIGESQNKDIIPAIEVGMKAVSYKEIVK